MTDDEINEKMAEYKAEHPEVDWDVYGVYAVVKTGTNELERIGHARKDKILGIVHPVGGAA
jgi:hypothetical protein